MLSDPHTVLKALIRAFVVMRLETRDPYLDPGLVLLAWLRRPVIEMPLQAMRRARARTGVLRLHRRLHEVYPF